MRRVSATSPKKRAGAIKKVPSARQQRAAAKRRRQMVRKLVWTGTGLLAAALMLGAVWGWKTQVVPKAFAALRESVLGLTADAGLEVRKVLLEGRNMTPLDEIAQAVSVPQGAPILGVSVRELRANLEKLDAVKSAVIERRLPDTIVIHLTERTPVAFWQRGGHLSVIDLDGHVLPVADTSALQSLPVLVGDDVPSHTAELLTMIAGDPALAARVRSAVRVGERRWNVRFDNGVEVKLPEEHMQDAWATLAQLAARDNVLDKSIGGIDLRLPDRMYLRLPDAPMQTLRGVKKK